MFGIVRQVFHLLQKCPVKPSLTLNFHHLARANWHPFTLNKPLLDPFVIDLVPTCGLKVKGKPKRRCKDCYMVWRQQRLYVLCKTHGRHKQMSMVKDPKSTWILTHATQSKVRPW